MKVKGRGKRKLSKGVLIARRFLSGNVCKVSFEINHTKVVYTGDGYFYGWVILITPKE